MSDESLLDLGRWRELEDRFVSLQQQREVSLSGMWLFLATEVMFFGALFVIYTVYRSQYYATYCEMSRHLDASLGTLNTAVLLTSSLTMALAVQAAKLGEPGRRAKLVGYLLATQVLGIVFLGIKALEWTDDYRHGLFPGHWTYAGPSKSTAELFFFVYYTMVGLHGLHVLIGVVLIGIYGGLALRGRYSRYRYMPIEVLGLYWHFVDLIWVFLYPLFYLIDRG